MQPLIMSISLCLLGFAACVLIFAAANRGGGDEEETRSYGSPLREGEQFFLDDRMSPDPDGGGEGEDFLQRLRLHVRREKEAAQAFLESPSADSLHASSEPPLQP